MGCQMNESSSDYLEQALQSAGYKPVNDYNAATLILINTCTVRAKAQQKAFSFLGRMILVKKKNPDTILGFLGCIAQQEGGKLLKKYPEIDFVLGTRETDKIKDVLERVEKESERIVATDLNLEPIQPFVDNQFHNNGKVTAFLSIMEGCNNFCSYCIVPYVRGREVSRSPESILNAVTGLVSQGVKEVTLLGQNVNSYIYSNNGDLAMRRRARRT